MRLTVHFDIQPRFQAGKVQYIRMLRHLLAELVSTGMTLELNPKQNLRQAHLLAQFPRAPHRLDRLDENVRLHIQLLIKLHHPKILPETGRWQGAALTEGFHISAAEQTSKWDPCALTGHLPVPGKILAMRSDWIIALSQRAVEPLGHSLVLRCGHQDLQRMPNTLQVVQIPQDR